MKTSEKMIWASVFANHCQAEKIDNCDNYGETNDIILTAIEAAGAVVLRLRNIDISGRYGINRISSVNEEMLAEMVNWQGE